MSTSNTAGYSGPYLGDGVSVTFPFTFWVSGPGDVAVLVAGVPASGFVVAVNANGQGGSVTLASAPASGAQVLILAAPPLDFLTQFEQGSAFNASSLNAWLQRLVLRDQALARDVGRALLAPIGEAPAGLPALATRAGQFLAFDTAGNPVASNGTGADAGLRTDLDGSPGAGLVGFNPTLVYPGGSAGAHLAMEAFPTDSPWLCDPTGATDCTTSLQAYFTWCAANGVQAIDCGGATYLTSAPITSNVIGIDFGGSTIKFRPAAGYADLTPALLLSNGLYANRPVKNLVINGPEGSYTMANAPTWCPNPGNLPNYSAFAPGTCAIRVIGSNQPFFDNVRTSGCKVGLLCDTTNGHIFGNNCYLYGWLCGLYVRINSEGYFFYGGEINAVFASVLIGTLPQANHFGGALVGFSSIPFGFSAYGIYQVTETMTINLTTTAGSTAATYTKASGEAPYNLSGFLGISASTLQSNTLINGATSTIITLSLPATASNTVTATINITSTTPTNSIYGTIDEGCSFEQIGEAVIQVLPQSNVQNLRCAGQGFSWSQVWKNWGVTSPNGWASNLHPSILPYDNQQQYVFRLGKVIGYNDFGKGNNQGAFVRSPYATTPLGIAIAATWSGNNADFKSNYIALNDSAPNSFVATAYDSGSRRMVARGGDPLYRDDARLPQAFLSPNLLNWPEDPTKWTVTGAASLSTTTLTAVGAVVPQSLYDLVGQNPVVLKLAGGLNGGATLGMYNPATGGSGPVAARPNKKICLSFFLFASTARTRLLMASGTIVYDYDSTLRPRAGSGWLNYRFDGDFVTDQINSFQLLCATTTTTSTVTTTAGSTAITYTGTSAAPGQSISGTGIPANTTLVSASGGSAVMSAAATATSSPTITATLSTWQDVYICGLQVNFDDFQPYNPSPLPAIVGAPTSTTAPAAGSADALPTAPAGYLSLFVDGVVCKLPYY